MRLRALTSEPADPPMEDRPGEACVQRPGVSLGELLVVLVVVSILSVLVVPQIEIVRFRMDGQTRGVMMALVTAQRTAVKRQHDVVVAFDTAVQRLWIHEDEDNDGVQEAGERTRYIYLDEGVRYGRGTAPARTVAEAETVNFTDSQDGVPAVRFHRDGSASQEGLFYLTSGRSLETLRHPHDARAIHVARATGRATWYQYDGSVWEQGS